jgi:hypothetical protein
MATSFPDIFSLGVEPETGNAVLGMMGESGAGLVYVPGATGVPQVLATPSFPTTRSWLGWIPVVTYHPSGFFYVARTRIEIGSPLETDFSSRVLPEIIQYDRSGNLKRSSLLPNPVGSYRMIFSLQSSAAGHLQVLGIEVDPVAQLVSFTTRIQGDPGLAP